MTEQASCYFCGDAAVDTLDLTAEPEIAENIHVCDHHLHDTLDTMAYWDAVSAI